MSTNTTHDHVANMWCADALTALSGTVSTYMYVTCLSMQVEVFVFLRLPL